MKHHKKRISKDDEYVFWLCALGMIVLLFAIHMMISKPKQYEIALTASYSKGRMRIVDTKTQKELWRKRIEDPSVFTIHIIKEDE